ncbi:TetR/AcrR family transcriptional regulator [Frankia sp. Cpl3]|nr:TetR/AcrR family transcriptional regulator [Frankia sp. Cpl3]
MANRERILAAAEAVFGEYGAAGSTEDVARRAEVGIATVFRHFPTKAALVEAALVRHFDLLNERARTLAAGADPGQAFQDLLRTMVEDGSTKLTLISQLPDGQFPPSVHQAADRLRATVEELLDRAARSGAIRRDVGADEVYLLVRGIAQACATMPTTPHTVSRALDVVLAGLSA